ncbi:DUF2637 domain-containing protein [Streptomyces montanus]|uniref:DUF2637 domain-containing protein n=1 Tax=Streptomyces montanus TaxID=2580423 RepID=A0A5R9FQU0_9ACTN|nr:DUF2637 domain-containing protein [Streptomyces montanus]TLS45711.1 DUF2637 domain-containing protein [Streptomyces montanus]
METLVTAAAWLAERWQISVGTTVVAGGSVLLYRAMRRSGAPPWERPELDEEARVERRERRGRRAEDVMTLVVAAAAAYLSSTGLRKFGEDVMGLASPWDWLPFVGLDVAALVCGLRARRRARKGSGSGLSGTLFWLLIGTSALFSATEADTFIGSVARAAWPLISGVLFELGSLEERLAAREKLKRGLGLWLERKVAAVRMLHPVEWVRVQLALAADETISQEDATRQVRIERAGYWLYRLRRLQKREDPEKWQPVLTPRLAWADRRAQTAQARVNVEDFGLVLEAVQRRVRTREFAGLNYNTPAAAEKALANLIGTSSRTGTASAGTDRHTGTQMLARTGTAGILTDGRTGTTEANPQPRTGTQEPDRAIRTGTDARHNSAVPVRGTGDGTARTGTGDADRTAPDVPGQYSCTAQVGTGTASNAATDAATSGTTETDAGTDEDADRYDGADEDADAGTGEQDGSGWTDEQAVQGLREVLDADGKFGTGGIQKTATHFGMGPSRAKRLMEKARELGPLAAESTQAGHAAEDAPADGPTAPEPFDIESALAQARPVADLLKAPSAASPEAAESTSERPLISTENAA